MNSEYFCLFSHKCHITNDHFSFWYLTADSVFCSRRVWLTPVKTVSWKQRSEPPCRRPTTSPRMSLKPQIPPDQTTSQMLSLSLTARVLCLLTAQTAKRQYPTKRKVLPANTPQSFLSLQPSSVYILIVPHLPTESLRTKKTTTVTRKRKAKRTTWSPRLLFLVILSLMLILEGTTVPQRQKVSQSVLVHQRPAPPQPVMWSVLMTTVRLCLFRL